MPIYEYQCESCGHRQDALQRISDDPLVDCAACGQPSLRKLMSAPRFRLKGSGWYETDFKTDNKRNLADGGDGEGKSGTAEEGAKSAEARGGESKGGEAKGGEAKGGESSAASNGDGAKRSKTSSESGKGSASGSSSSATSSPAA